MIFSKSDSSTVLIDDAFIASSIVFDFPDIMLSNMISIDSFAISPFSKNSNVFAISSFFNNSESRPFLSKFVIVEQNTDATNVGFTLDFSRIFSNRLMYFESKICSANCKFKSYFVCNSFNDSSHDLGTLFFDSSNSS